MANDAYIRQIVQQELAKSSQSKRFNLTDTTRHQHTKNDSAPVSQNDITPGNSVEGTITFAQTTVYKIGVNFNPTSVFVHGNVTGNGGEKFLVVGNAQFGPSFYLQPGTSTSVVTGGPRQTIIQSSSYFGGTSGVGGALHTVADEGHIVDVEYPLGTIHARATIIGYDNKNLLVEVNNLDGGWAINLSFTIT